MSLNKEAEARAFIKKLIHERDGIVLGIDPLGHPCRCNVCEYEREHDDKNFANRVEA